MMGRRWRRAAGAAAATAALALVAAVPLSLVGEGGQAHADVGLLGYNLHATAPGVEIVFDSGQIPTPTRPAFTGTLPEATADLDTGPSGTAFASIAWPGSLAGNLGTTLQQLNFCAPATIPAPIGGQCLPADQQNQLKQILKPANDPVRAQARTSGPNDASYGTPGALYMTSHATGTLVTSDAGVTSVVAPPAITFGSVTSRARSVADEGSAVGEAMSSITSIAIGVGLQLPSTIPPSVPISPNVPVVSIDSVVSTVKAISDGDKGTATGSTLIGGVRVLGMPATIDGKGIHIGPSTNQPTNAVTDPLITAAQTALSFIKFKVTYAPDPLLKTSGSSASATAQGMILSFVLPDGTPAGASYQITLGKALATADASPEFEFDLGGTDLGVSEPFDTGTSTDVLPATVSGTEDLGAPGAVSGTAGGSVPITSQGAASRGVIPGGGALGAGLVLLALAAAGVFGFGLKRLSDGALAEAAGTTCPRQGGDE
jgi:hypothetical protein